MRFLKYGPPLYFWRPAISCILNCPPRHPPKTTYPSSPMVRPPDTPSKPITGLYGNDTLVRRLLAKTIRKPGGCWIWQGATKRTKRKSPDVDERYEYGVMKWEGRTLYAHRLAYAAYEGPINEGVLLGNECGHVKCISPKHWRLMVCEKLPPKLRNQGVRPSGYKMPFRARRGKLTDQAVISIRIDPRPNNVIALEWQISEAAVWRVKHRKMKAHVLDPVGGTDAK